MTAIVTAIYGGSDIPHPQVVQNVDVEWFCFTDDPDLEPPAPWQVVVAPATDEHPRRAAKVHKFCPNVDHDDVIWIDGSMQVITRTFAREALAARRNGLAVWKHPRRDCIYREAEACVSTEAQDGKYIPGEIAAQIASYHAEGHPEHAGLYACGTLAWNLRDPKMIELGAAWLAECRRWSSQDQLSLPVVLRRAGITPGLFPLRQITRSSRKGWLENRWLRIHPHRRQNVEGCVDADID